MANAVYFFDSYAIIEIILGNSNYKPYTKFNVVTTKLNIFEVYHGLLRDVGEMEAEEFLEEYYPHVIDFNEEDIRQATNFKVKNRQRNLSMSDCIGYVISKRLGIKFLTGDKEFKDFENVEFVK